MKFSRNDYFFDFKTLTLQDRSFKYKKKDYRYIKIQAKKDRIMSQLNFYLKPNTIKRLKLKKYFLAQLFIENKKIFKLTGFLNKHFLKKMFLRKKLINNVLVSIEKRLDVNLVRSRLLPSIKFAQQAIKYGYIYVNKEKILSDKYLLKQYDVVTINPNFFFITSLPYVKSFYIRYKIKENNFSSFNNILKENFVKLIKNFNFSTFVILINKAQISIFTKIQILLILSLYLSKKNSINKNIVYTKFYTKFYYLNRVRLNYINLFKNQSKIKN